MHVCSVCGSKERDVTGVQIELSPPDPADEEAVAYYNAQRGMHGKTSTLKRGMAGTRRRPAISKFGGA